MLWPCCCHVMAAAMPLQCRCHAAAMPPQCHYRVTSICARRRAGSELRDGCLIQRSSLPSVAAHRSLKPDSRPHHASRSLAQHLQRPGPNNCSKRFLRAWVSRPLEVTQMAAIIESVGGRPLCAADSYEVKRRATPWHFPELLSRLTPELRDKRCARGGHRACCGGLALSGFCFEVECLACVGQASFRQEPVRRDDSAQLGAIEICAHPGQRLQNLGPTPRLNRSTLSSGLRSFERRVLRNYCCGPWGHCNTWTRP